MTRNRSESVHLVLFRGVLDSSSESETAQRAQYSILFARRTTPDQVKTGQAGCRTRGSTGGVYGERIGGRVTSQG